MRLLTPICFLLLSSSLSAQPQEDYPPHPDSLVKEGVPQGEVKGPFKWESKIFPGTVRDYWVYVPQQYDASKPACVMIVQDGLRKAEGWKIPTVLDNLIHEGAVPVQIGIFVSPGVVPAPNENAQPRFNRSFEYDGMGDRYARFLIEEILPAVEKNYNLSDDPNDCLIAGSSSGAIAAFTAAWERPDRFRRVFSAVGTFVGLRGGNEYPILIRKHETKPIRVFLQDGSNDLNIYGGSWWHSNLQMLSALEFSGYDVKHVWGTGGHNGKQSTAIMPDALRWLWRDYPEPVEAGTPPHRRTELLVPGEDWEPASAEYKATARPAANDKGEVFFPGEAGKIYKIALDGKISVFKEDGPARTELTFGSDGKLYACQPATSQVVRFAPDGTEEAFINRIAPTSLLMLPDFGYISEDRYKSVWKFTFDSQREFVDQGIASPSSMIVSPDQTLLTVADARGRFTYSFQIQPNGLLKHKQRYGYLHVRDDTAESGASGMAVDTEGRIYVATDLGLQVLDQLGRVHLIVSKPEAGSLSSVIFGGKNLDELYVTCGEKLYKRKIQATGVISWKAPVKPPKPRL